jgi:hypothetical protein
MANPERGEVAIIVNDKPYTLRLTTNAIAETEARTKKKFSELLADIDLISFTAIRDLCWLLLRKHHKEQFKTLDAVGDWIDDAGGFVVLAQTISEAVALNRPESTGEGAASPANPPPAQPGTGASSS